MGGLFEYVATMFVGRAAVFLPPIAGSGRSHDARPRDPSARRPDRRGTSALLARVRRDASISLRDNKPVSLPLEKLQDIGGIVGALDRAPALGSRRVVVHVVLR